MPVRPAGRHDLPALIALRAVWRGTGVTPTFAQAFTTWFDDEAAQRWWWVAVDITGQSVGMVNLRVFSRMPSPDMTPSRWGYLANLFVMPEHRGCGLGAELLTALLGAARERGLVRVVLSPSEASRPLYARHGFGPADGLICCELADQ